MVRGTEVIKRIAAGYTQRRLHRSAWVIQPGVNHFAVARAGLGAKSIVAFEDDGLNAAPCQRAGTSQADCAGTYNDCFDLFHRTGIVNRLLSVASFW